MPPKSLKELASSATLWRGRRSIFFGGIADDEADHANQPLPVIVPEITHDSLQNFIQPKQHRLFCSVVMEFCVPKLFLFSRLGF